LTKDDIKSLAIDQDFLFANELMRSKINVESIVLPMAMK
jgi:hypothetical protein